MVKTQLTLDDLKDRIATRLSDSRLQPGGGGLGTLRVGYESLVTRTFRAHWTGFKIFYPQRTVVLKATLSDGRFWSEAYISATQPSWVLAFRRDIPAARGSWKPRPDDEVAPPQALEVDEKRKKAWLDSGVVAQEDLIRMEDYDDPLEAIDGFFNFTTLYMLKAVGADWSQLGYEIDASMGWAGAEASIATLPIDSAIDEGLKKSDIIWLTPDNDPRARPVPCWYVYTKDQRLFVLSGERQQVIPRAGEVREVKVVTRWKGRDARMAEFSAAVRPITARDPEFEEIAHLLLAKRQGVVGTTDENLDRWKRDCVILELTPRV